MKSGCANLIRHIENANKFGISVVVALNKFSKDITKEIELVIEMAKSHGAFDAVLADHWAQGGAGAKELAEAVVRATSETKADFKFLYELGLPIEEKIRAIAQQIYHAADIQLSELAQSRIELLKKQV